MDALSRTAFAYEISARKVLAKLGVELVEMPEFNCCGLPLDPVSHETMLDLGSTQFVFGRTARFGYFDAVPRLRRNFEKGQKVC